MKTIGFLFLASAMLFSPLQALAGFNDPEWNPPARFDHPFSGKVAVIRLPQRQLQDVCRQLFSQYGYGDTTSGEQRGCSIPGKEVCIVVTIDKTYKKATPAAVLRHEEGHCNGWPSDHSD